MSFKIKSTVSIYEYPPSGSSAEGINHMVLSRQKLLHPGEIINVSGFLSRDVETKTWESAEGRIRIIDVKTLGIRWRLSLLDALVSQLGPERLGVIELRQWEPEREVKGGTPLELRDIYHTEPRFPEVFTLVDKARIGPLTEKMLRRVEGIKRVDRKTELIYEL